MISTAAWILLIAPSIDSMIWRARAELIVPTSGSTRILSLIGMIGVDSSWIMLRWAAMISCCRRTCAALLSSRSCKILGSSAIESSAASTRLVGVIRVTSVCTSRGSCSPRAARAAISTVARPTV